ncbi:MAG: hypothetical protein ACOH16_05500 [Propionibacteriaceae bacterium]
MKILWSPWIMSRIVPGLVFGGAAAFFLLPGWEGDDPWPLGGGCLLAMIGCLVWAASDVVVITRTHIRRGLKTLELSKIQDLTLDPVYRLMYPKEWTKGYEIVALTPEGDWRVGLFGPDRGKWGGIDPKIRARLTGLRAAIMR